MGTGKQLINSTIWTFIARVTSLLSQLVATLILARILEPSDFAIMGILLFFINISQAVIDSGMGGYLIKKNNPDSNDYATMFIFNISTALIIYFLIYFLAPLIEGIYDVIGLSLYIRVGLISIIFSSLGIIQNIQLLRQHKFKQIAILTAISSVASLVVTIIAARNGLGIWALILQNISLQLFILLFQFYFSRYIPEITFSINSLREQWNFGSSLLASHLLQSTFSNILNLILPRLYSLRFSGLYAQANRLSQIPINLATSVLHSASFPVLSRIDNKVDFKKYNSLYAKITIYLSSICLLFLSTFSSEIVEIVLGEKWLDSAYIFAILSIGGIAIIISNIQRNTLKSLAYTSDILSIEIYRIIITVTSLILSYMAGENAIIIAFSLSQYIICFVSIYKVSQRMDYTIKEQILDIMNSMLPAIVASLFVYIFRIFCSSTLMIICAAVLYFIIAIVIDFVFCGKLLSKIFINKCSK